MKGYKKIITVGSILFLWFSTTIQAQEVVSKKQRLVEIYQENFDRLNQKSSCPSALQDIKNVFFNPEEGGVLIASHRGDHMVYPENSLAAFTDATKFGTSVVELDVRNSSDDSLMVIHDKSLNRTTNGEGNVSDYAYSKLKSLSLLDDFTGEVTKLKIPTLYEALSLLKGKVMIDLDIKCDKITAIYSMVEKLDMFDQTIFFCDQSDMDYVLSKNPDALVMPRARSMENLEQLMEKYHPKIVHIDDQNFNVPEAVKLIRKINPSCRIWANSLGARDLAAITGDDSGILELYSLGINVVQTDLPRYAGYLLCPID